MDEVDFAKEWQNINYLIPIYDQWRGNSTEISFTDGKKIIMANKTTTVVKKLARVFAVDLAELKRKYGILVGRKTSTPLPLHPHLTLISVKIRIPLGKDEGARGFIIKNKIVDFLPLESSLTRCVFTDGTYLDCRQSVSSLNLALAHAEIIQREYTKNYQWGHMGQREELYKALLALLAAFNKENRLQ